MQPQYRSSTTFKNLKQKFSKMQTPENPEIPRLPPSAFNSFTPDSNAGLSLAPRRTYTHTRYIYYVFWSGIKHGALLFSRLEKTSSLRGNAPLAQIGRVFPFYYKSPNSRAAGDARFCVRAPAKKKKHIYTCIGILHTGRRGREDRFSAPSVRNSPFRRFSPSCQNTRAHASSLCREKSAPARKRAERVAREINNRWLCRRALSRCCWPTRENRHRDFENTGIEHGHGRLRHGAVREAAPRAQGLPGVDPGTVVLVPGAPPAPQENCRDLAAGPEERYFFTQCHARSFIFKQITQISKLINLFISF